MEKDILITMHEDLKRALAKPAEKRHWAMLIDLRKCVGCHACTVACMSENKTPPGMHYRPVHEYETGKYPKPKRTYLPTPCMQCDKPPCVDACPVKGPEGATWKETKGVEAGIVKINYEKCLGCEKCVPACPYGSRSMDSGQFFTRTKTTELEAYEKAPSFEYGKKWTRQGMELPSGNARKCHFCVHRLANGMIPQCTSTCIGRATYFGDLNDPESLISQVKLANAAKIQVLLKNKGTQPRVYYISDENIGGLYEKK